MVNQISVNVLLIAVKPDVKTLCDELVSVSDWRKLGLNLGVQDYELAKIQASYPAEGCDGWKRESNLRSSCGLN